MLGKVFFSVLFFLCPSASFVSQYVNVSYGLAVGAKRGYLCPQLISPHAMENVNCCVSIVCSSNIYRQHSGLRSNKCHFNLLSLVFSKFYFIQKSWEFNILPPLSKMNS